MDGDFVLRGVGQVEIVVEGAGKAESMEKVVQLKVIIKFFTNQSIFY